MLFGAVFISIQKIPASPDAASPRESPAPSAAGWGADLRVHGSGQNAADPAASPGAASAQAERRLRPFARRRARTARPVLVLIRIRNPCVLLR